MKNLETALKITSSSVYCFQLKVHHAHLNVEGPDFYQYHKLLDDIYKDVWESFDTLSEQIRALDIFAPASLGEFHMMSVVEDAVGVSSSHDMMHALLLDNDKLLALFDEVNSLASSHLGLQNFIQGRCDAHEKWGGMLRSTLK